MKNRKLYQLFIASVVSAAMMTSGVSVGAADFSDDAAVAAEQSVTSEEDAAPVVDAGSDFSADTAEATSDVAIDSTNFPDEQLRIYLQNNFDLDNDGKLSASEISAAKTINVSGLGISKLTGIEYFTSLTELNASDNKLSSVNLTKNTKLTYINVGKNSLKTLDLSKCTKMQIVVYSNNQLTKVTMPAKKYLGNLDYVDASYNKFTTQANAGLNIGDSEAVGSLSQVNASNNAITSFNCAGFVGILDLRNNKIATLSLSNDTEGCQATALYIDGNTLSKTSSVDFTPEWINVPQQFSCDTAVASKVKMVKSKLSGSATWNKVTLSIGSSSNDATYKLQRKTGSGSYKTIKTWGEGELDDPEFGDTYTDPSVTPGTTYTYRLLTTVQVQDANRELKSYTNTSSALTLKVTGSTPSVTVKSSKTRTATVTWKAVSGASGYDVYYGTSKAKVTSTVKKGTKALTVTKTKLTKNKTYYFRVRAYKVINGKKVYTAYSSVKSVKVK